MPGTATGAELQELSSADGAELEALFLQLMIRHHRGGVEMAAVAGDAVSLPLVRGAANLMATDQTQEIAIMVPLLKEREPRKSSDSLAVDVQPASQEVN